MCGRYESLVSAVEVKRAHMVCVAVFGVSSSPTAFRSVEGPTSPRIRSTPSIATSLSPNSRTTHSMVSPLLVW